MTGPSVAGNLPEGDANGLAAIAADLVAYPKTVRVVIALVDTVKITTKCDTGIRAATVRIRRVEVVRDEDDAALVRRMLRREFERRTGAVVLPFELERDVEAAFGADPDPDEHPDQQHEQRPDNPEENR